MHAFCSLLYIGAYFLYFLNPAVSRVSILPVSSAYEKRATKSSNAVYSSLWGIVLYVKIILLHPLNLKVQTKSGLFFIIYIPLSI